VVRADDVFCNADGRLFPRERERFGARRRKHTVGRITTRARRGNEVGRGRGRFTASQELGLSRKTDGSSERRRRVAPQTVIDK
jgi:hypothetical protein